MERVPLRELVTEAARGDERSFASLFQRYYPGMMAYALRRCADRDEAEDVVQEAFILAFTRLDQLRVAEAFCAWMHRIVEHCCARRFRDPASRRIPLDAIERHDAVCVAGEASGDLSASERAMPALARLPAALRVVVLLRFFGAHTSYQDIALILGIPIGTVRSRLAEAKKKLVGTWRSYEDHDGRVQRHAERWQQFYRTQWRLLYEELPERSRFLDHFAADLRMRYTSGAVEVGRLRIADAIEDDLAHGSRMLVDDVMTSGDITIISASNVNSADFPDHCPPASTMVLFRDREIVARAHLHLGPRQKKM